MAEPEVENGGGGTDEPSPESGDVDEEDVDMVETDVSETGADPEGFFDGVETDAGQSADDVGDLFDGVDDEEEDSSESAEADSTRSTGLASDINAGCARAAVIGLDDEWTTESGETKNKDDLKDEFEETFEAFRLGHYGSKVVEEYLMVDAEDIHPVWGLVGAMLICAAVVVYRRPDGSQIVSTTKNKLGEAGMTNLASDISLGDDDEDTEDDA